MRPAAVDPAMPRTAALYGALALTVMAVATAQAGGHEAKAAHHHADIVDTAIAAGSFTTLVAALQAAGLVDALRGNGPLTVFAPTDAAFAALPAGTVDDLLKPENRAALQGILLYHVVSGKVMSGYIGAAAAPATLQGATVEVQASTSGVTVNGAKVITADVVASNGVIHVIDAVILPPASY